jgi:hypothetical protein
MSRRHILQLFPEGLNLARVDRHLKKTVVKNLKITLIKYFRINYNFPDSLLALFCLTDVIFGELLVVYKVYLNCPSED